MAIFVSVGVKFNSEWQCRWSKGRIEDLSAVIAGLTDVLKVRVAVLVVVRVFCCSD